MNKKQIHTPEPIGSENGQHLDISRNKGRFMQRAGAVIAITAFFSALVLAGTGRPAFARQSDAVYLFVNGTPTLQSTDYYQAGHILDVNNNVIGTCPDTNDGRIYNNGQTIGFIDPSETGVTYLGY